MGEIMNSKETSVFFCFEWVSDFSHWQALPVIQCAQSTYKPRNKGWLVATVGEICATDTYQPGESGPSLVAGDLTDNEKSLSFLFIFRSVFDVIHWLWTRMCNDYQQTVDLKAAVNIVVILADFLSVLQLAVPSLLSTSPYLLYAILFFKAALLASFFSSSVYHCSACLLV